MRVLLFNDTDHTWKRHAAGYGPAEIPPHTGDTIDLYDGEVPIFIKVWNGVFLVRSAKDAHFANAVGEAIGARLDKEGDTNGNSNSQ